MGGYGYLIKFIRSRQKLFAINAQGNILYYFIYIILYYGGLAIFLLANDLR